MTFENGNGSTPVPASSVVVRGIDAQTFSEMETFVKDLERRPMQRLLRDLPQLVMLSETKVSLVSYVMAGKYRAANNGERMNMRETVAETVEKLAPGEQRDRVAAILDRMRS